MYLLRTPYITDVEFECVCPLQSGWFCPARGTKIFALHHLQRQPKTSSGTDCSHLQLTFPQSSSNIPTRFLYFPDFPHRRHRETLVPSSKCPRSLTLRSKVRTAVLVLSSNPPCKILCLTFFLKKKPCYPAAVIDELLAHAAPWATMGNGIAIQIASLGACLLSFT